MILGNVTRITADEAVEHLTRAAFEVTDPESEDFGRKIVHCFAGSFGADWDLEGAVATVRAARDIAWTDNIFSHDLTVLTADGKMRYLAVKRPAPAETKVATETVDGGEDQ